MTRSGLEEALDRVGDRWTMLVVDALLERPRRFGELQAAVEGIATNVLSQRLRRLEEAGVVVARAYSRRPARFAYELTGSGRELAGVLAFLARWGTERRGEGGGEGALRHGECGTPVDVRWYCPTCDVVVAEGGAHDPPTPPVWL